MPSLTSSGNWEKTRRFLVRNSDGHIFRVLESYAAKGILLLEAATPKETGETAYSWGAIVTRGRGKYSIEWFNTHVEEGVNIAVIIQYGHGTGTGGYVAGIDYINPALRPLFDQMVDDIWREVTNA